MLNGYERAMQRYVRFEGRATPARNDVIAEIERLGHLRREGHLSEAEFEVMKAETLAQGRR